jgi:hypothetical protein
MVEIVEMVEMVEMVRKRFSGRHKRCTETVEKRNPTHEAFGILTQDVVWLSYE